MAQPQSQLRAVKRTMREQFQFDHLRPGQEEVIRSILSGRNTLAIMPTGGGKSLCYQLPALHLPGTTVVVSPLISLMKDQLEKVQEVGVDALEFNSTLSSARENENKQKVGGSDTEIVYVTPERLDNPEFLATLKQIKIDFVVVDEAHCVSQWGHDFRPAFLNIPHALAELGNPPVLALTATATPDVIEDIRVQLKLPNLAVFNSGILRDNLRLEAHVVESEAEKEARLLELLSGLEGAGIIYVSTVNGAKRLQEFLRGHGRSCLLYHGRMKISERTSAQDEFMADDPRLMIATNAFGMGIDKPDIRYVIHYNFPGSLEAYYQEAGRAGRDGDLARCILLYLRKDKSTQSLFLARKYPAAGDLEQVYQALHAWDGGEIEKRALEEAFAANLPKRKLSLLTGYLKHLEILAEPKRGRYRLLHRDLSSQALNSLAEAYRERQERDREKLKRVIVYAQTALCRWKMLADYFGEEVDWTRCGHCDNCEHPVLDH